MKIVYWNKDIELLRPIGESWMKEQRGADFGIEIDLDFIMGQLTNWMNQRYSDVIVLMDGDEPVGLLVIFAADSFLGSQLMALERFYYVIPGCRTGTRLLREEAIIWAKLHNCSHLIYSASALARKDYQRLCTLYEHAGFRLFESSFVMRV